MVTDPAAAPGDEIRARLVTAAAEVFAETGYDRARVAEIAERAGLTTGAIYGRFRGKAALLQAAIEACWDDEFEQLFAEHRVLGGATDILATVGSHLVTDEFDSGQALLLEAVVAARRDPDVAVAVRRAIEERSSQLRVLVEEAKQTGGIDPALDTLSVVRFCHAVGLGFLLMGAAAVDRPEAAPWEQLIERLVAAVEAPAVPDPTGPADPGPSAVPDRRVDG